MLKNIDILFMILSCWNANSLKTRNLVVVHILNICTLAPLFCSQASGGMFSNVTGKVSGWLPSNLPSVSMPTVSMPSMPQVSMPSMPSIPGLRKSTGGEDAAAAGEAAVPEQAAEAQTVETTRDDDDRSR